MDENAFAYTLYIRTTASQLWDALTAPELTRRWWWSVTLESNWVRGATYALCQGDLRIADDEMVVLDVDAPRRVELEHLFQQVDRWGGIGRGRGRGGGR